MAGNAFQEALSHAALQKAWLYIYRKSTPASRKTIGTDEVSINSFEPNSQREITRLAKDLRGGRFKFQPLKPYLIPKSNGKYRLICVPTVRDRIVQRALVDYLASKYHSHLANEISYGFVKGRSVKEAAAKACSLRSTNQWAFKTDITSFFDTIERSILRHAIKKIIRERTLHPLLFEALNCEVDDTHATAAKQIKKLGIKKGKGVRQGMPLAPFFSNLMLASFDKQIFQRGLKAVRYADDLIFFTKSEKDCLTIAEFCSIELGKLALLIPEVGPTSKSVIYEPGQPVEFLGLELAPENKVYQLRLATRQIEHIRSEILQFGSIHELLARRITLKNLSHVLTAKCNGYLAAYDVCKNIEDVAAQLSKLEQKALRKIYTEGLQIDLTAISNEAKAFLGIR